MRTQTPLKTELFASALRKVTLRVFAVCAVLLIAAAYYLPHPPTATAAANGTLNFQARLQTAAGAIVPDGYYNIQFKLYNVSSGGTALWTESFIDTNGATAGNDFRVQVINGYASVNLGSLTAFPGTINWDQDLWLTMNIGGTTQTATPTYDGEMNPRLKLTAVPYAFQAKSATQLQTLQGAYTGTLDFNTLTASRNIHLPDEDGTVCLQGSTNCGFLTGSAASGAYVQLQSSLPGTTQTGNFNITGTGIASILQATTSVQTTLLDTAAATALNIGTTNATQINLNQNTQVAAGKNLTFAAGAGGFDQSLSTGTFKTGTGAVSLNGDVTVASGKVFTAQGPAVFQNATDSINGFAVKNSAGTNLLNVDTSNGWVGINNGVPSATLDVNATGPKFYSGFESGSLGDFSASGSGTWSVVTTAPTPYAGSYAAKFAPNANTTSTLSLTKTLTSNGTVSFYYRCDKSQGTFYFQIDSAAATQLLTGCPTGGASGPWTYASFPATAGAHTFKWYFNGGPYNTNITYFGLDEVTVTNVGTGTAAIFNNGGVGIGLGAGVQPAATLDINGNIRATSAAFTGNVSGAQAVNGNEFTTLTQVNGLITAAGGGSYVNLQASTPGTAQTGNFNITGTGIAGVLQSTTLTVSGNATFGGTSLVKPTQVAIKNTDGTQRALTLQAASGQSVDLFSMYDAGGSFVSGYDASGNIFANGSLNLGTATSAGTFKLKDGTGNTVTIRPNAQSGSYTYVLPASSGNDTICLQNLANCGAAPGTNYVKLQATTPGTADLGNFNINGTGIANILQGTTSVLTASLDTAAAGTLNIGNANATTINIGTNAAAHTIGVGTGAAVQTVTVGSTYGSSALMLQTGNSGFSLNTSGTSTIVSDSTGKITFKPTTNGSATFRVQNADASVTIFSVDTTASAESINMYRILQTSAAIQSSSYLTMAAGTVTNYLTPAGSNVPTKINVVTYNPGDYGQVLAMGIPSYAASGTPATARVLSLFDARISAHQPTITVFDPTEAQVFGLSWDGSSTLPILKSSTNSLALQAGGSNLLTANFIGGNIAEAYLGTTGSTTGRVTMTNSGNTNTVSLQAGATTASYVTNLPTAIGTAGQCLYVASVASTTQNLGYTTCGGGGGGSYVNLQASTPGPADVGNFNINGTGIANILQGTTGVRTASLDTVSAGTLSIGNANATTINIGTNAAAHAINIGSTTGASSVNIQSGSNGVVFNNGNTGVATGYYFQYGGTNVLSLNASGDFTYKSLSPSTSAFTVQNASRTVFRVDTQNELANAYYLQSELGISSSNIYLNGDIGGNPSTYVSPVGTNIQARINIKNYDPTSYHTQIAAGLPSTASQNSSSIMLFDARTTNHRPTISVLSPDESQVMGLSWEGTNTTAFLKTSSNGLNFQANNVDVFSVLNSTGASIARIGVTNGSNGSLQFANATNANVATIQATGTTASYTINLPTAIGTAGQCLYVASVASTTQNLGYTTCGGGGGGSYVNLQASTPGTADVGNFNINGTGIAAILRAGSFDTASAVTMNIGSTNASAISIGKTTTNIQTTINGTALIKPTTGNDSATALQVQNAAGNALFTADTSAGQVLFGKASTLSGKLVLANATNANTVTITTGATSASYTITLPTSAGAASQCLMNSATPGVLTWGTCGSGGGSGSGGTQTITLIPEFVGATFSTSDGSGASSGNNTGYMTSDFAKVTSAEGYKHNYYQWYTDQSTAQDYHIITQYQLPSNFTSFAAGSWTAWSYRTSTSGSIGYTIYDAQGNSCSSGTLSFSGSASTWYQSAMSNPSTTAPCSFAANDIITIDFKLIAQSPSTNYTRLGEVRFSYN